jgi:hypothetical protein
MKANTYKILQDCIENGIRCGWNRAHKHTDTPEENVVFDRIEDAIMLEINEYFVFEELNEK